VTISNNDTKELLGLDPNLKPNMPHTLKCQLSIAIIAQEFMEVIKKRCQSRVGRKRLLNDLEIYYLPYPPNKIKFRLDR